MCVVLGTSSGVRWFCVSVFPVMNVWYPIWGVPLCPELPGLSERIIERSYGKWMELILRSFTHKTLPRHHNLELAKDQHCDTFIYIRCKYVVYIELYSLSWMTYLVLQQWKPC